MNDTYKTIGFSPLTSPQQPTPRARSHPRVPGEVSDSFLGAPPSQRSLQLLRRPRALGCQALPAQVRLAGPPPPPPLTCWWCSKIFKRTISADRRRRQPNDMSAAERSCSPSHSCSSRQVPESREWRDKIESTLEELASDVRLAGLLRCLVPVVELFLLLVVTCI